jgi:hypothetical protein
MIPIFMWFALCSAVALVQTALPNLFPSVGNYAAAGVLWAGTTVNNTRRLMRTIMAYGTATLILWLGSIAFAIYKDTSESWIFAIAALISTAVTLLTLAVFGLVAKTVIGASLSHINTTATAWSAAIPLRTMAWHAMPPSVRWRALASSPLYGLYLLFALPTKGMLEVIIAIAKFGPTFTAWMKQFIEILAAISVVCFTLATVAIFQIKMGYVIITLPFLGLVMLFIAILVALLLLQGKAMVDVKEFIETLGHADLYLIGILWFDILFPSLAKPLQTRIHNHFYALVANVWMYDWAGMIVVLGIFALLASMPWCRKFAGSMAMAILFIWTLSLDPTIPFYTKWDWWGTFVALLIGWVILRKWKTPTGLTHAGVTPNAPHAPVAPAAPAAATAHAGGHGNGHATSSSGSGWWIAFAFVALLAMFILGASYISANTPQRPQTVQPILVIPPSVSAAPPTAPAPTPVAPSQPPAPVTQRDPVRHFEILDAATHSYQLDAREMWRELDITAAAGRYLRVTTDPAYKTCSAELAPCADADGYGSPLPNTSDYQFFPVHNGTTRAYALLGRWGHDGEIFVIGNNYNQVIPAHSNTLKLWVMNNVATPASYRSHNTGGHLITSITIQ